MQKGLITMAEWDQARNQAVADIDQKVAQCRRHALRQFRRVEIDFANREVRFTMPRDAS